MSTGRERTWAPGSAAVMDVLWRPGGPQVSTAAKGIYSALFSHMSNDYTCYPSVATIAEGTGIDARTVQRHLSTLEAAGLVERIEQKGRVTRYRLYPPWNPRQSDTPDKLSPPANCHPRQDVTPDSMTEDPRQIVTPTPGKLSPEVTHIEKPNGETQLTLLPVADKQPSDSGDKVGDGYSLEFEQFWAAYPRRKEKAKAYRVWLARMSGKGGVKATPEELISAAKHYAQEMRDEGREQKHIKLPATFLGPDNHWTEYRNPPEQRQAGSEKPGRYTNDKWAAKRGATA